MQGPIQGGEWTGKSHGRHLALALTQPRHVPATCEAARPSEQAAHVLLSRAALCFGERRLPECKATQPGMQCLQPSRSLLFLEGSEQAPHALLAEPGGGACILWSNAGLAGSEVPVAHWQGSLSFFLIPGKSWKASPQALPSSLFFPDQKKSFLWTSNSTVNS